MLALEVRAGDLDIGDNILVSRFKIDLSPGFYNPPPPPVPKTISKIETDLDDYPDCVYLSFQSGERVLFNKIERVTKLVVTKGDTNGD